MGPSGGRPRVPLVAVAFLDGPASALDTPASALDRHIEGTCKAAAVGTASSLLGLLGHGAPVGAAHSANPFLWFPLRFPLSNLDWAGTDSPPGCPATILGHFDCFGPIFAYFDDCIFLMTTLWHLYDDLVYDYVWNAPNLVLVVRRTSPLFENWGWVCTFLMVRNHFFDDLRFFVPVPSCPYVATPQAFLHPFFP